MTSVAGVLLPNFCVLLDLWSCFPVQTHRLNTCGNDWGQTSCSFTDYQCIILWHAINNLLTYVKIGVSGKKKVSHVCLSIKCSHCIDTWVYWIELLVVNTFKILLIVNIWPKTNDSCSKENAAFIFFHQPSLSPQTQAIPPTTALHLGDMRDNCRTLTVLINYGFPCSAALWSCRQFHDNW